MNEIDDGNKVWYANQFEGMDSIGFHAIVKRTARFVYVRRHHLSERTVRLDRAKLEANGSLYLRRLYETIYTTRKEAESHLDPEIVAEMHRIGEDHIETWPFWHKLSEEKTELKDLAV
jgi:hypothetical protein